MVNDSMILIMRKGQKVKDESKNDKNISLSTLSGLFFVGNCFWLEVFVGTPWKINMEP